MKFSQSDKVVCVIDPMVEFHNGYLIKGSIVRVGQVYCVEMTVGPFDCPGLGLVLVGSTVFWRKREIEVGWWEGCFRLLSEVKSENQMRAQFDHYRHHIQS